MNRGDAKRIAQDITDDELGQMFENAKLGITNWSAVSSCNKWFSKGTAWNILYKAFALGHTGSVLGRTNMIREFGDFLPGHKKPPRKPPTKISITHQEPIFDFKEAPHAPTE
jgi:hypothetical protein